MASVTLAATVHDPEARLARQLTPAVAWLLTETFDAVAIQSAPSTGRATLEALERLGSRIGFDPRHRRGFGHARREALRLALRFEARTTLLCDFDRILRWATHHGDELRALPAHLTRWDLTVIGRSGRAFASHPRVQRDTESIVNHVFARVSGREWDVTSGARAFSIGAARAIVETSPEYEGAETDTAWPMFLRESGFSAGYHVVDGLEYETADRHEDAVERAGGVDLWMAEVDADPREWLARLDAARRSVWAILPYVGLDGPSDGTGRSRLQ
jgi:hypothetical protein